MNRNPVSLREIPCVGARLILSLLMLAASSLYAQDSQWVRPQKTGDPLIWGRRDGVVFGLQSAGGMRGPRGLIRVGVFNKGSADPVLINFIAVEPVIVGAGDRFDRMAFSELEMSDLDPGKRGKRMWVDSNDDSSDSTKHKSSEEASTSLGGSLRTMRTREGSVERLSVRIDVEKFNANGAHVYVIASVDSDQPSELRLSVFAENDSPAIEQLTLTATMGNYERLRLLWLNDRVETSKLLFPTYDGDAFIERDTYLLSELVRSNEADATVFCTSDEPSPRDSSGNHVPNWTYTLPKLTQYWRVPGYDVQPDLRVRVNARHDYWASHTPVPGGNAFENFELRQRYVPGQTFIFGISPEEPWQIEPRLALLKSSRSRPIARGR